MNALASSDRPPRVLEEALACLGLRAFRPGQRDVIETVLAGRDCLCVMPTGSGKSLCYQLPAMLDRGFVLVISPLIALMKDQVDQLSAGHLRATFINSAVDFAEQSRRIDAMRSGGYDLVYVAPERFRSVRFMEALRAAPPRLFAVDEAHCISEWGHDFRPDYTRLGRVLDRIGRPTTLALTATATDTVRRDIADQLRLRDAAVIITGFDRPNLRYEVQHPRGRRGKEQALVELLREMPGSGIVYASTRNRCEEVAEVIRGEAGRRSVVYHAGLLPQERSQSQEQFMTGKSEVVVATNAFGMGIDKRDIRFVIHYNFPGSIEAYYQEAGRAGRDGQPSRCVLLYSAGDRYIQEFFIENEYPAPEVVERIYDFLRQQPAGAIELTQAEIKERVGLESSEMAVGTSLRLLAGAGAVERLEPHSNMALVRIDREETGLAAHLPSQAAVRRRVMAALEKLVGERRGEDCYFHPDTLARQLELERPALVRAFRALEEQGLIDYVPPFRGRAVRVLDRKRPFDELTLDFEQLAARKAAEYEKLERVVRYASTSACRRGEILRYFGERAGSECGNCDNCGSVRTPNDAAEPVQPAVGDPAWQELVRMALSGVARVRGRFGKNVVAQMLTGSNSQVISRRGLDRLSTYGLLKSHTQSDVVLLLDYLLAVGCLEQEEIDRFRPVLKLTSLGRDVMTGDRELHAGLQPPPELTAKFGGGDSARHDRAEADSSLLNRLQEARRQWAAEEDIPAYRVLHNRTLEELARTRPQTRDELIAVKGMGPAKAEQYGERLLKLLHRSGAERVRPAPQGDAKPAASGGRVNAAVPATERPSYYWTWVLLEKGFRPDECAAIRGMDEVEIFRDALEANRCGYRVRPQSVFRPDQIEAMNRIIRQSELNGEPPHRSCPDPSLQSAQFALFAEIRGEVETK